MADTLTLSPLPESQRRSLGRHIRTMVRCRLARFDAHSREDAVQGVWLDLLAGLSQGRPSTERRVQTLVERHVKRVKREAARFLPVGDTTQARWEHTSSEPEHLAPSDPELVLAARRLSEGAQQRFQARLSDTQRCVIVARAVSGLSVKETQRRLDVSRDVVINELARGLQRLVPPRSRRRGDVDPRALDLAGELFLAAVSPEDRPPSRPAVA